MPGASQLSSSTCQPDGVVGFAKWTQDLVGPLATEARCHEEQRDRGSRRQGYLLLPSWDRARPDRCGTDVARQG
jgi:hypothetical protein